MAKHFQWRRFIFQTMIFIFLTLSFIGHASPIVHAQVSSVPTAGVFINEKIANGIDPIIIDGEYYVPFVDLSHILGYNHIQFEENTLTYEVTDGSVSLRTTMGGTKAKRGDEYININPPRWINKTAYIPLNGAGVLFNAFMYFEPKNGSIQIQKPAQQYIVQNGDTLWIIAQAHHTTIEELKKSNSLKTDVVQPGQSLKIPPKDKTKETEPIEEEIPIQYPKQSDSVKALRSNVLDDAVKYIGAGYKFGATLNEAPHLFDCSSYTQLIFQLSGIDIPRVSRDQASMGNQVTELKKGDLMFFTNNELYSDGRVGHVGIYMGDGSMIHASSSLGVAITDNVLGNPYWGANYLFSKRIIK